MRCRPGPRRRLLGALIALAISTPEVLALDANKRLTQYTHRAWQSEDGLPQNTIFDITQTPEGYLWLATTGGLVRFDGVRMTVFTRANTDELVSDQFYAVATGSDGELWIGSYGGGLQRYRDGEFETLPTFAEKLGPRVSALASGPDGTLCVGTYDSGAGRWHEGQLEVFDSDDGLSPGVIFATESDGAGGCWVGVIGGGLHHIDDQGIESFSTADGLPSNSVWGLHRSRQGHLWIGTDHGLVRHQQDTFETWTTADGLSSDRIKAILEDRDGTLWIGTQGGGLDRWSNGQFEKFPDTNGEVIWSLLEDREGSLWIGSLSIGLHQLTDRPFVTFSVEEGLTSRQIHSLVEDEDNAIWFTTNSGLHRFHQGAVDVWTTADGLSSDTGWPLLIDRQDRLLVGSGNGEIDGFDRQRRVYRPVDFDGRPPGRPYSLLEDRNGAIWIGTNAGLSRHFGGEVTRFSTDDGLPHRRAESLLEDRSGQIWVGTLNGLARFDGEGFSTAGFEDLAPLRIRVLYEDSEGVLWIGSYGGGLARWSDDRLTLVTTREGLFSDSVTGIVEDGLGHLWLSSARGIFRVSKSDLDDFATGRRERISSQSFGRYDGLKSSECLSWQPTSFRASDGRLWFATMNGLAVVDPSQISHAHTPEVIIQDVDVGGTSIGRLEAPRLEPGNRPFAFRFAAATLAAPEKIRYRYRLEGLDSEWIDAGMMHSAYYASLPAGRYVFEVMASDEFGHWGDEVASFAFSVRPRFTQTPLFYGLCGLALLGLGLGVQQIRVLRLHRRKQEADRIANEALAHVKVLSGLLPICARCKKIRDDAGKWNELEVFIDEQSEASFTHSVCPTCTEDYLRQRKNGVAEGFRTG